MSDTNAGVLAPSAEAQARVPAADRSVTAQLVLSFGGLVIGTGEFASMGLLPNMAASMGVSVPEAGGLISAYALGVVIGSPILAVLTARVERRRLLVWMALLMLVGNAASAFAHSYAYLFAARFLAGVPHGTFFGVAAIVVASLVPKAQRTQAIGRVMLGLAAANLAGVPLVTFLGQQLGWRSAFALIALGGGAVAVLLPVAAPRVFAEQAASPLRELSGLKHLQVWLTLATAAIGFGGMFAVYSYITPTLTELAGQPEGRVPLFLGLWGLGMVVGNIVGSWLADRWQSGAIIGLLVWNAVSLALFVPAAHHPVAVGVVLFVVGVGFALSPALQSRLMDVAPDAPSLAGAMNHSAFNLSNAVGAWAGGAVIAAGWGWASTGAVASVLALAGLGIFVLALKVMRPRAL